MNEQFEIVRLSDHTVYGGMKYGRSLEEIIVRLVEEKEVLKKEIVKLTLICPQKHKMPDGTIRIWHCPDHLIPD